ncbi:MAG: hypothetical protein WA667_23150 [Candidatus Nitrosopolaris sp.]
MYQINHKKYKNNDIIQDTPLTGSVMRINWTMAMVIRAKITYGIQNGPVPLSWASNIQSEK